MKIAVCRTKSGPSADAIYNAFINSLMIYGDTWVPVTCHKGFLSQEAIDRLEECDISMQVCEGHLRDEDERTRGSFFRSEMVEFQQLRNKRRIVFETGFVKNNRRLDIPLNQRYFQVGYDGMKGLAQCYNSNSPGDRWSALDTKLEPWRTTGSHILIMGQNAEGASVRKTDVVRWWEEVILEIQSLTNRPIKMRPHPTQVHFPFYEKRLLGNTTSHEITKENDIKKDLEDCWCVVALSTSAAVDAIIQGIPVITPDEMCMAYDVASHSISDINNPATPDRTQWLNDLAYSQWSIDEIHAGLPWGRLRGFAQSI